MMVKMPRKNAVNIIEEEQVSLGKEIEANRKAVKDKTREMLKL